LNAVPIDLTRLLISLPKSPPPASPTSKFSNADFTEVNEPDIVVLASFAVVPVTPNSV